MPNYEILCQLIVMVGGNAYLLPNSFFLLCEPYRQKSSRKDQSQRLDSHIFFMFLLAMFHNGPIPSANGLHKFSDSTYINRQHVGYMFS